MTTDIRAGLGSLSVGFSTPAFAMPMIVAFTREYPGISIRCRLGNTPGLLEALASCQIEVAVITLIDPPEGMACRKIAQQRVMRERAFALHGLSPNIRLEVASRDAGKEAIAAGIGFGVVLDGEMGNDSRLAAVQIKAPPICGNVYAVALPESLELPALRAFFPGPAEST